MNTFFRLVALASFTLLAPALATAQTTTEAQDYVIGPNDVLLVQYWRDADHSAEVTVRPDGLISLPLLNEVMASGRTPSALAEHIRTKAAEFLQAPTVTVFVKQINSRKAYITGEVVRPGAYSLSGPTTVLQLIAMSGGLTDFADKEHIMVLRSTAAGSQTFTVNYKQLSRMQNLEQNLMLLPGDTILVR